MKLVKDVQALLDASPEVGKVLKLGPFADFSGLAGALLGQVTQNEAVGRAVQSAYAADAELVETTCYDISETARRNFEPGGDATTLLFSRGVQAVMAHRVAHKLWLAGDMNLSLAVKATCGRTFATDIHPAAKIGAGLWLDHGLGFVVGETAVIAEDVSIWHSVTLGSTLTDSGAHRHPHIGSGVLIGAGAILLGGITVGNHANIAAGSIVVEDIPEGRLVVGSKATVRGASRVRFAPQGNRS